MENENELKQSITNYNAMKEVISKMTEENCKAVFQKDKSEALEQVDRQIARLNTEIALNSTPTDPLDKLLADIAVKNITTLEFRKNIETMNNDSYDFIDVAVWELKSALKAAYNAGRKNR